MMINGPHVFVRENRVTEESVNVSPKNSLFSPGCSASCGLGPVHCAEYFGVTQSSMLTCNFSFSLWLSVSFK